MRQIMYVSTSTVAGDRADLAGILEQSRHNNALDGVTGLLWSDGANFMQIIEGPAVSVVATFDRIVGDRRHHDLQVLHNLSNEDREFDDWTMVHKRAHEPGTMYRARIGSILARASPAVADPFFAMLAAGPVVSC